MDAEGIEGAGTTALMRRLRPLIGGGGDDGCDEAMPGWRDDLRLFAFTWAAGFVFFLLVLA